MWISLIPSICRSRGIVLRVPTVTFLAARARRVKSLVSYAFHLLLLTMTFFVILPSAAICGEGEEQAGADGMWIGGNVIWPGHDLTKASVKVFRDPQFKELYTEGFLLKPEGIYTLIMDDPGTYYIVAFVDDNGNGRFDAGDGMGIYGVIDWADPDQKPKPLRLEEGTKLPGIDIQITAIVGDQGRMKPVSSPESGMVTGISGKLIWPNHEFSNAIVFVYSDPSWNNRIAQTNARKTGEYEIGVLPGRYYLLAVIDENDTNLLDVGDKFGIWGMTRFGMFPKAVKVDEEHVIKDRNILIIGQMGISGKPLPLHEVATVTKIQDTRHETQDVRREEEISSLESRVLGLESEDKIVLSGNVVWPGHDLKHGMVQAYSDPSMTVAAASYRLEPRDEGLFRLAVPPGDYYIVAGVDADGDGKYTTGDGIGAYGVANAADQMPEKLTVTTTGLQPTPTNGEINLVITAEFDASGQLKPISQYSMRESSIQHPASSIEYTGIAGRIVWEGRKISKATLIFSDEPRFESGISAPLDLNDDGSYNCSTPPGDYYIMAIMGRNDSDQAGSGDGIGFYGAGYWGAPQKVTVLEGRMTPYININVTASLGPDGKTVPIRTPGSIRFRYGEPDNIYTDPTSQEWWYWDKGISFTFEKTDAGWNLIDTYEFDPGKLQKPATEGSEKSSIQYPVSSTQNGTVYYTFDRTIWAMNADGMNRRWIAPGTRPTAARDGGKLLFLDTNGSIYLVESGNDASVGARHALPLLVLSRRKAGLQPVISHNGKVIAFTRDSGGYRRLILKNLETGEESAIPAGAMDVYHPAWSPDDELIAYSAAPFSSPDQRNRNGDIYYHDLVAGRTERVSISPLDEFEPAWSPIDKRVLIYCRAEGEHAQLWIVNFDADGKPIERQLTKYGGRNPAWSPGGDKIIYENNAQLWTINPDGSDESPMIVDGEPILGLDPFWTR